MTARLSYLSVEEWPILSGSDDRWEWAVVVLQTVVGAEACSADLTTFLNPAVASWRIYKIEKRPCKARGVPTPNSLRINRPWIRAAESLRLTGRN